MSDFASNRRYITPRNAVERFDSADSIDQVDSLDEIDWTDMQGAGWQQ